jgi:hypothetical protein
MASLHLNPAWVNGACLAAALVVTLILAALLTPRHWWRRANARALAVLAGGTALFGYLFMLGASTWFPQPTGTPLAFAAIAPLAQTGHTYRVFDDLNVRAASGTGAARIAVVPGGANVTTTGRREGDWWEVTATVDGRPVTGWVSSLWLRRDDERRTPQLR